MNVQTGMKNSAKLVSRLARKVMAVCSSDNTFILERVVYERARSMTDVVIQRYATALMSEPANSEKMRGFYLNVCDHCRACQHDGDLHFDDHEMGPTLRSVMIFLVCEAVVQEIQRVRYEDLLVA